MTWPDSKPGTTWSKTTSCILKSNWEPSSDWILFIPYLFKTLLPIFDVILTPSKSWLPSFWSSGQASTALSKLSKISRMSAANFEIAKSLARSTSLCNLIRILSCSASDSVIASTYVLSFVLFVVFICSIWPSLVSKELFLFFKSIIASNSLIKRSLWTLDSVAAYLSNSFIKVSLDNFSSLNSFSSSNWLAFSTGFSLSSSLGASVSSFLSVVSQNLFRFSWYIYHLICVLCSSFIEQTLGL